MTDSSSAVVAVRLIIAEGRQLTSQSFYHVLSCSLTLILAFCGVEGIAHRQCHTVETVVATISSKDVTLLKGIVAKVEQYVVACRIEYVGARETHHERPVLKKRFLHCGSQIPIGLQQSHVTVVCLAVEL